MAVAATPVVAPVVQPPPAPDLSLDADIAAFIAEGHEPDEEPATAEELAAVDDEAEETDDGEDEEGVDGEDADGDDSDESGEVAPEDSEEPEDDDEEPAAAAPSIATAFDLKALKKALESDDPVAFVKALGKKAETLLTGKAHRALRLQVKEFETAKTTAEVLATQLGEKYGDPIAARKAAETGDVDAFITMVEKWAGHPWNDVAKWVTNGIAGRPGRLEQKQREVASAATLAAAKQEQAVAEMTAWVDGGVKKLAPELHDPETVALVVAEIRAGFNDGVTTPAKAIPLVRKKLEAQYQRLHKVFGKGKPAKTPAPAPSARIARAEVGGATRETSLDEDIADFMAEQGLKSGAAKKKKKGSK